VANDIFLDCFEAVLFFARGEMNSPFSNWPTCFSRISFIAVITSDHTGVGNPDGPGKWSEMRTL
jgi:hypothetical protein